MSYYFTFGTVEDMVYKGGWVEIKAETRAEAMKKFADHYKERAWKNGLLNYAGDYTQEQYETREMFKIGNLGAFCHEVIE